MNQNDDTNFERLEVWRQARDLNQLIFEMIVSQVKLKDYPLKDQMNRAAASVMDNIAEGHGRGGNKELIQYLFHSRGSCYELISQLKRVLDRGYLTEEQVLSVDSVVKSILRQLNGYINYLKSSTLKGSKFK